MLKNTKGLQRGGGGSRKGIPNLSTGKVRERARRLVEDKRYASALRKRLIEGTLSPYMEGLLWQFAYGKPKEVHQHEVTGVTRVIEVILAPDERKGLPEATKVIEVGSMKRVNAVNE